MLTSHQFNTLNPYPPASIWAGEKLATAPELYLILSDEERDISRSGNVPLVRFKINLFCGDIPLFRLRGVELLKGRIHLPQRENIKAGLRTTERLVAPDYWLLDTIRNAILASNWTKRWPDIEPPLPLPRGVNERMHLPDHLPRVKVEFED
jgi:hypothetical protein